MHAQIDLDRRDGVAAACPAGVRSSETRMDNGAAALR